MCSTNYNLLDSSFSRFLSESIKCPKVTIKYLFQKIYQDFYLGPANNPPPMDIKTLNEVITSLV